MRKRFKTIYARTRKHFAFLPISCDDGEFREVRWLEYVKYKQEAVSQNSWRASWKNTGFIDN